MNDAVTSLLTEHLSYTPLSLIDDIINSINNLIYQAISSLETGLLNTPPERLGFGHANNNASTTIPDTDADGNIEYPEARLEIENGLHQLETLFESSVDKSFDKFEIYVLRNILTVPDDLVNYMKLGHYENLSFSNDDANTPTPESINLQRRKLRETRKLQQSLQMECAQNDAVIAQLRAVLSAAQEPNNSSLSATSSSTTELPNLSFLTSGPAAKMLRVGQNNSLTTNTDFVLSQLPALHAMAEKLRSKLSTLPTTIPAANIKRDERREYIESRIKMHLERSGEPALGDGNAVFAGRKISSAEAQALEAVGNILNDKK